MDTSEFSDYKLDNNISMSDIMGIENQLLDLVKSQENGHSNNKNNQSGGGFFSSGCDENDKKALLACQQGKYDVVSFMIMNDMIKNYCTRDGSNQTILHHIAKNVSQYHICKAAIRKILSRSDRHNFLNIQNNEGSTPLIVAVDSQNQELTNLLINAGADKNIRNNEKLYVCTDSERDIKRPHHSKKAKYTAHSDDEDSYGNENDNDNDNSTDNISGLGRLFSIGYYKKPTASETMTDIDNLKQMPVSLDLDTEMAPHQGGESETNTDNLLDLLLKTYGTKQQTGGSLSSRQGQRSINNSFNTYGGARRHDDEIETEDDSSSSSDNEGSESAYAAELSRFVKNQAGEILDRVVQKIMKDMNVGEDDAKIYKHII